MAEIKIPVAREDSLQSAITKINTIDTTLNNLKADVGLKTDTADENGTLFAKVQYIIENMGSGGGGGGGGAGKHIFTAGTGSTWTAPKDGIYYISAIASGGTESGGSYTYSSDDDGDSDALWRGGKGGNCGEYVERHQIELAKDDQVIAIGVGSVSNITIRTNRNGIIDDIIILTKGGNTDPNSGNGGNGTGSNNTNGDNGQNGYGALSNGGKGGSAATNSWSYTHGSNERASFRFYPGGGGGGAPQFIANLSNNACNGGTGISNIAGESAYGPYTVLQATPGNGYGSGGGGGVWRSAPSVINGQGAPAFAAIEWDQ